MLQTVRVEIVDEKNEVICLLSRFPFWVIVIKLSKKVEIFAILCWAQQEIYVYQSNLHICVYIYLVTRFQKMILFIMVWLIVLEILGFEAEEFC